MALSRRAPEARHGKYWWTRATSRKLMRSSGSIVGAVAGVLLLTASPAVRTQSAPVQPAPVARSAPAAASSTIRAVTREVLPEAVRVTIELDREVPFYQERVETPPRLFFDLKGTQAIPKLVDADFKYDNDVVREIRLGRH